MIEDKLTKAERVRLEALAQSIVFGQMKVETPEITIERAKIFEKFIKDAREDA